MSKIKIRTSNGWKEIAGLNGKDGYWFQGLPDTILLQVDSDGNFYPNNKLSYSGYLMQGDTSVICTGNSGGYEPLADYEYSVDNNGRIDLTLSPMTPDKTASYTLCLSVSYNGKVFTHNIYVTTVWDGQDIEDETIFIPASVQSGTFGGIKFLISDQDYTSIVNNYVGKVYNFCLSNTLYSEANMQGSFTIESNSGNSFTVYDKTGTSSIVVPTFYGYSSDTIVSIWVKKTQGTISSRLMTPLQVKLPTLFRLGVSYVPDGSVSGHCYKIYGLDSLESLAYSTDEHIIRGIFLGDFVFLPGQPVYFTANDSTSSKSFLNSYSTSSSDWIVGGEENTGFSRNDIVELAIKGTGRYCEFEYVRLLTTPYISMENTSF